MEYGHCKIKFEDKLARVADYCTLALNCVWCNEPVANKLELLPAVLPSEL